MDKAKGSTRRAQYEQVAAPVREQAKHEREAAKLLGISVAEVRERIAQGRAAKAGEEQQQQEERRQKSIKYSIEQIDACLSDAEDMARAIMRGDHGMTAEGLAHGIVAISGRAAEFLRDLCRDLGLKIEGDDRG